MKTAEQELRAAIQTLRRSPLPLADLIPLLQKAADEIERLQKPRGNVMRVVTGIDHQMRLDPDYSTHMGHAPQTVQINADDWFLLKAALLT